MTEYDSLVISCEENRPEFRPHSLTHLRRFLERQIFSQYHLIVDDFQLGVILVQILTAIIDACGVPLFVWNGIEPTE